MRITYATIAKLKYLSLNFCQFIKKLKTDLNITWKELLWEMTRTALGDDKN